MLPKPLYQATEDVFSFFFEASEEETSWGGYSGIMTVFISSLEASLGTLEVWRKQLFPRS